MLTVAALYHFTRFEDPAALQPALLEVCKKHEVRGTLLLAQEGINGTIAGSPEAVAVVLDHITSLPGCAELVWKESPASDMPFGRMKVRVKSEIVTMGQPGVDPVHSVGHYVEPADWNELISAPDVVVIDTRNDYETAIGTFQNAVDPQTRSFRQFPDWWQNNAARFQGKRIAMFCTGGIRCEKSTNYLISQGVSDVFHLKGGILKYLEDVAPEDSLWQGECFVFDKRVSLTHGLGSGSYTLCHACRRPLAAIDMQHADFEPGVSCHRCKDEYSDDDRARFRDRQRQLERADRSQT